MEFRILGYVGTKEFVWRSLNKKKIKKDSTRSLQSCVGHE